MRYKKAKKVQPAKKTKAVRIDEKTIIFVDQSVSDEEARNNFFLKIEENRRKFEKREVLVRWS